MTTSPLPRPTRSRLLNQRLNAAIHAAGGRYPQEDGLRTAGRRSSLPRADRAELGTLLAGGAALLTLIALLAA